MRLTALAEPRGIRIVEDCAHAAGATYQGRKAGSLGDIGVFSFHQQKNMITLGEGGMVTTSDPQALRAAAVVSLAVLPHATIPRASTCRSTRAAQPMGKRYWLLDFADVGYNYRMTDAQAAVGLVQLAKLDGFNRRRREIAEIYRSRLAKIPGLAHALRRRPTARTSTTSFACWSSPSFALDKEDFMWELYTRYQIKVWSHYMPIHLTTAYRKLGHGEGECPRCRGAVPPIRQPADPSAADARGDRLSAGEHRGAGMTEFLRPRARDARPPANCSHRNVPICVARAPGRLDLMGGNDDYTGGMVFEATIREATWAAAQRRTDGTIVLVNPQMAEHGWQPTRRVSARRTDRCGARSARWSIATATSAGRRMCWACSIGSSSTFPNGPQAA